MKDWSKERWRKLYLREALEQRLWSVMARGLRDYLIRLADDDGALIRDADDPVEALLTVLGAHDDEAELVRGAIELLRRDGFLGGGARSLFVRNLPVAQSWEAASAGDGERAGSGRARSLPHRARPRSAYAGIGSDSARRPAERSRPRPETRRRPFHVTRSPLHRALQAALHRAFQVTFHPALQPRAVPEISILLGAS